MVMFNSYVKLPEGISPDYAMIFMNYIYVYIYINNGDCPVRQCDRLPEGKIIIMGQNPDILGY